MRRDLQHNMLESMLLRRKYFFSDKYKVFSGGLHEKEKMGILGGENGGALKSGFVGVKW